MAYRVVDSVFVVIHSADSPADDEWDGYLECYRNDAKNSMRTLVITDGGGPNTKQRALMNEELAESKPTVAICTDNRVVRGIVAALGWFNRKVRAFSKSHISDALKYLGLSDDEMLPVLDAILELEREVNG